MSEGFGLRTSGWGFLRAVSWALNMVYYVLQRVLCMGP